MRTFLAIAAALVCLSAHAAGLGPQVAVFPSGPAIPENLLRISIQFAQSPGGEVLAHLALRRADGQTMEHPFYPQPLWSPDGHRLTLLLDPARVKLGLAAHQRFGRALQQGEHVALLLNGKPIKQWRVTAEDDASPMPKRWHLGRIVPGSRKPLQVTFTYPIDVQSKDLIAVADSQGQRVQGVTELVDHEMRWRFTPSRPWATGNYQLVVNGGLEDSAGNSATQAFEYREPLAGISDHRDIRLPLASVDPALHAR